MLLLETKLKATCMTLKFSRYYRYSIYSFWLWQNLSVGIIEKFYNEIRKLAEEKDHRTKNDNNGKQTWRTRLTKNRQNRC